MLSWHPADAWHVCRSSPQPSRHTSPLSTPYAPHPLHRPPLPHLLNLLLRLSALSRHPHSVSAPFTLSSRLCICSFHPQLIYRADRYNLYIALRRPCRNQIETVRLRNMYIHKTCPPPQQYMHLHHTSPPGASAPSSSSASPLPVPSSRRPWRAGCASRQNTVPQPVLLDRITRAALRRGVPSEAGAWVSEPRTRLGSE